MSTLVWGNGYHIAELKTRGQLYHELTKKVRNVAVVRLAGNDMLHYNRKTRNEHVFFHGLLESLDETKAIFRGDDFMHTFTLTISRTAYNALRANFTG